MLCILLVHSVSHLMITLFVSLVSSSVPSSSQFPLSPLPYCAAAPCLCRNHRGSCLFTLFLGIKAVAITRCQIYGTPKTLPFPFCVFLSPDTVASRFHHLGDLHSEGPMAERGSPVADKTCGSRAYGVFVEWSRWRRMSRSPGGVDLYCGRDPRA